MVLLLWFSTCCLPTVASAEPLRFLLWGAGIVLPGLTVDDSLEGRGGVKVLLLFAGG